jgi:hypothetical protein
LISIAIEKSFFDRLGHTMLFTPKEKTRNGVLHRGYLVHSIGASKSPSPDLPECASFSRRSLGNSYLQAISEMDLPSDGVHVQRACASMGSCAADIGREKQSDFQTKLSIGLADDIYEQQADQVAHQLMSGVLRPENSSKSMLGAAASSVERAGKSTLNHLRNQASTRVAALPHFMPVPTGLLQRKCACEAAAGAMGECAECAKEQEQTVQRKVGSQTDLQAVVPSIVHEVLRSPGQPLDLATRAYFEPRFGHDFSQVRVHADPQAAESAQAVNALAYTVGQHIILGVRHDTPQTETARKLLAHELTHVVQQTGGLARSPEAIAEANSTLELEAERSAQAVMHGGPSRAQMRSPIQLARQPAQASLQPTGGPPFFGLSAASDAVHGIVLFYNVTALPHTDYIDLSMLMHRGPYIVAPNLRRNPDGTSSIEYYIAFRQEPGWIGPTNWHEYVIGPDAIEEFLSNLHGYAAGGAIAYMFGPPAPNAIAGSRFVDNMLAGEFGAAVRAYGRSLYESVKDPNWWTQMIMASASLVRGPAVAPRVPTPEVPVVPEAPIVPSMRPPLTIVAGAGGGPETSVVGRVGGVVYPTEGGAALAVRPVPAPAAPPAPTPLRLVPPPPAAGPAPAPAGPLIPPEVAAAVTAVIAARARLTRTTPSPYTSPRVGPEPEATEESTRQGCVPGTGPQLGAHNCHHAFAMSISGVPREFTLRTPEGLFESFDALGPDGVLYEVKTGHRGLVYNRNMPGRQERIDRFVDQAEEQLAVATRCSYPLVWVFNDPDVREFFAGVIQPRTMYQPFPCEIDSE